MSLCILAISDGRFRISLNAEVTTFALTDIEGPAQWIMDNGPDDFSCSSSCDFPQEDGAPPGWKFDSHWEAILDQVEALLDAAEAALVLH